MGCIISGEIVDASLRFEDVHELDGTGRYHYDKMLADVEKYTYNRLLSVGGFLHGGQLKPPSSLLGICSQRSQVFINAIPKGIHILILNGDWINNYLKSFCQRSCLFFIFLHL